MIGQLADRGGDGGRPAFDDRLTPAGDALAGSIFRNSQRDGTKQWLDGVPA